MTVDNFSIIIVNIRSSRENIKKVLKNTIKAENTYKLRIRRL